MHKFQSLIRQEKRKNSPSYVSKCLMSLYYYWLPLVLGKNFITLCFVYWKNSARILCHKDFVFYYQFPSWFYLNWQLFEFIYGLFLRIQTTVQRLRLPLLNEQWGGRTTTKGINLLLDGTQSSDSFFSDAKVWFEKNYTLLVIWYCVFGKLLKHNLKYSNQNYYFWGCAEHCMQMWIKIY